MVHVHSLAFLQYNCMTHLAKYSVRMYPLKARHTVQLHSLNASHTVQLHPVKAAHTVHVYSLSTCFSLSEPSTFLSSLFLSCPGAWPTGSDELNTNRRPEQLAACARGHTGSHAVKRGKMRSHGCHTRSNEVTRGHTDVTGGYEVVWVRGMYLTGRGALYGRHEG